jgi:hypothetical protein
VCGIKYRRFVVLLVPLAKPVVLQASGIATKIFVAAFFKLNVKIAKALMFGILYKNSVVIQLIQFVKIV